MQTVLRLRDLVKNLFLHLPNPYSSLVGELLAQIIRKINVCVYVVRSRNHAPVSCAVCHTNWTLARRLANNGHWCGWAPCCQGSSEGQERLYGRVSFHFTNFFKPSLANRRRLSWRRSCPRCNARRSSFWSLAARRLAIVVVVDGSEWWCRLTVVSSRPLAATRSVHELIISMIIIVVVCIASECSAAPHNAGRRNCSNKACE